MIRLLAGDCRDVLATLAAESVQCVVTSPPYYGLRDYGTALWVGGDAGCAHVVFCVGERVKRRVGLPDPPSGWTNRDAWVPAGGGVRRCVCGAVRVDRQIGMEASPDEYLATMVQVFREVRRVLRADGVCWVNMGDSYASSTKGTGGNGDRSGLMRDGRSETSRIRTAKMSIEHQSFAAHRIELWDAKPKDLLLMPARLALALQGDGWWVRSDVIWHKPNPMPESCRDRPTSAHEHVFLLTKAARYYYDSAAVAEQVTGNAHPRGNGVTPKSADPGSGIKANASYHAQINELVTLRACRNVWTIATHAYPEAHFATFPPELAERCIRAGTRLGDTVLDPFIGAGTTALVADRLQRDVIGIDLNVEYTRMAMDRCIADAPLFTSFVPAEDPEDGRMADLFAEAAE